MAIRGPVAGKEALYGKYTSLYYPNSFINLIRSTYPVISNGVIREFRALEGEFRDGARWRSKIITKRPYKEIISPAWRRPWTVR